MMSETAAANVESVEGAGQRHRVGRRAAQPRADRDLGGHHEAETESEPSEGNRHLPEGGL